MPQGTGAFYEDEAERYLQSHGLKTTAKNFHCRQGEVDLIMRDKNTLVFVEVRFRASISHGTACETVTNHKQKRICKAAAYYLKQHNLWHLPCRFDVIGINPGRDRSTKLHVEWLKNAFYNQ